MERLAFIQLIDEQGQDVAFAAVDVRLIREHPNGSAITLAGGPQIITSSSVATVVSAIDTLWGEYTTALGDPA